MDTIIEGSSFTLTVSFYDKNGALAVPTSATWTVIDLETGSVIQVETPISPIASSVDIEITPTINSMHEEDKIYETRRVLIKASYGIADKINAYFDYLLKNLEEA